MRAANANRTATYPDRETTRWATQQVAPQRAAPPPLARPVAPPPATPVTRWEWHARFPELAQFLGGWFSQDMPDEFDDHDAAVDDYVTGTHPQLVARLVGEVSELLALDLDESDAALAVAELGMEVDPPARYSPGAWLALVAERLQSPRADRGPGAAR